MLVGTWAVMQVENVKTGHVTIGLTGTNPFIRVQFFADGTYSSQRTSGCSGITGSYTIRGNQIDFQDETQSGIGPYSTRNSRDDFQNKGQSDNWCATVMSAFSSLHQNVKVNITRVRLELESQNQFSIILYK